MEDQDGLESYLDGIQPVQLPESESNYKFVLFQVSAGASQKLVIVGQPRYSYHRGIVGIVCDQLPPELEMKVLGGGRVEVSKNQIRAYGSSGDYGPAPQDKVKNLLDEHAEGRKIFVEMDQ